MGLNAGRPGAGGRGQEIKGLAAMTDIKCALRTALAASALAFVAIPAGPARAQESFDQGKTPAQLYASDCAICHKSPQGLAKSGGLFGLQGFLREHYTASRETAAAIASYLAAVDRAAPAAPQKRATRKPPAAKPAAKKPDDGPAGGDAKASDVKSAEPKPAAAQTAPKPAEGAKSGDNKPDDKKSN